MPVLKVGYPICGPHQGLIANQINYLWSRMKLPPKFGPDLNTREGDSRLEFYYPRLNEWKCEFTLRLDSEFDDGPDVIPDIQDQYTTICV